MSGISSFSLSVEVSCECVNSSEPQTTGNCVLHRALNDACSHDALRSDASFIVSSASIKISPDRQVYLTENYDGLCLVAIFVPKDFLTLSLLGISDRDGKSSKNQRCKSIEWVKEERKRKTMNKKACSIHPFLSNVCVRGVIRQNGPSKAAADILLIQAPSPPVRWVAELLDTLNGEGMVANHDGIIKVLPLSDVSFMNSTSGESINNVASLSVRIEIPPCPVCLHRIDPLRIGLPKPKNHSLCSKFCTCKSQGGAQSTECIKQRFLSPWPPPSHCGACQVIDDYWKAASRMADSGGADHEPRAQIQQGTIQEALVGKDYQDDLFCNRCGMQETLWVCLSCSFVGCGRYSNVHAADHYKESGHTFSLELATLRIWDYANEEFAHRGDLLECPSVRRTHRGSFVGGSVARSAFGRVESLDSEDGGYNHRETFEMPNIYAANGDETSAKKANMIGEEYEALLQSALEDQAQHYEGEITRLRATLTAEHVDEKAVTKEEMKEIEALNADVTKLRVEIDGLGRQLLDAQAQEAGYRASSQRLLREQAVAKDLLDKIREEAARENEEGKIQVEELEQQIADLTANLRIRHQFSLDEELSNAQIFGATPNKKQSKRGKKSRRFWK